jgi:glycosidase
VPGFYLGSDTRRPSRGNGDWFTRDWYDVKFIFHRADQPQWRNEFLRQREYMFRVMNYWVSQGVDGFRLDHATDDFGGMSGEEWRYLIEKVSWYAEQRGQERPVFLAEEFHRQQEMSPVVDAMTEGFLFDMNGRNGAIKNAGYVERVLENANRFSFNTYIKAGLENHDELRLVDGTGFSPWTGMGFWGLGAASWTMPMLLMGQEFGESQRLAFKRSAYLPVRFVVT